MPAPAVSVVDHRGGRTRLVMVLVGLSEGADVPVEVVERARTAAGVARRAGARVVHLSPGAGEFGQVIAHPGVGRAPEDVTVAPAPGGQVDDTHLDAILGETPADVVVAGTPTSGLVAEVARRAKARGLNVTVLEDACDDPDPTGQEAALSGPLGSDATLMDTVTWTAAVRPRRRRRVISTVAAAVVLALLITGVAIAHNDARNFYLLSPGSAPMLTASADCRTRTSGSTDLTLANGEACARLIVPASRDHGISGGLFMVDVLEGPATTLDYILNRLHLLKTVHDGSQLFPASSILGSTPADQLPCQNTQQMVQATTDAPVAALQRLGYDVREQDFGAQIDLVMPGYPAAAAGLACNDVINSINGHPVRTYQDVAAQLAGKKPGGTVSLGVASPSTKGAPTQRTVQVQLTAAPAQPGMPAQPDKGFLGVELETRSSYSLPFDITVQVGDIGGPSAGLALTLGIIDLLSNGQLTGSHKVAATGTITPDGTVGDVGGVAQKTVAVRKAGAQVFLVPPQELQAARSEAGSSLKVYAVQTLGQALDVLAGLGGKVPAPKPPSTAAAAPASG